MVSFFIDNTKSFRDEILVYLDFLTFFHGSRTLEHHILHHSFHHISETSRTGLHLNGMTCHKFQRIISERESDAVKFKKFLELRDY